MTSPEDTMQGAGITAKERLQNIETMLARIDTKIDSKFDGLDARIRLLEVGQAPPMKNLEDAISRVASTLDGVRTRMWMAVGGLSVLVLVVNLGIHEKWF